MKAYVVGGAVRDQLLGLPPGDRDWVVVGATPEQMSALGYKPVGRDFPVFLHPVTREEHALARTERKSGRGYRGFTVHASPEVTLEEDLRRRDLTINAMARDEDGTLVDPFGGERDLRAGILRHVGEAFAEDPVRILRVARFAARFRFRVAEETEALLAQMVASGEADHLVAERVWQELAKGLAEAHPVAMLRVLARCGLLPKLLPGVRLDAALEAALGRAVAAGAPLAQRFAVLAGTLDETGARALCDALRAPNDVRELALLAAKHGSRIASQPTFYGILAAEENGEAMMLPAAAYEPTDRDIGDLRRVPGVTRAMHLNRLGLRWDAYREWAFTMRTLDDRHKLAAAELARRAEMYDRAINTADRTTTVHNFRMRYLAPYREAFKAQAQAFELEEAWILGLVRQESRFVARAKSSAGAQGLMQLMPATARWVARKIGYKQYSPARVTELDTNITLGTSYLKMVLDDLGHPVLATAAYNGGPGRARRWRDVKPMEGAVFIESIPFNETRDYVKKVMANSMYYAYLLEGSTPPLKKRIGIIPPKSAQDRFNEDLP